MESTQRRLAKETKIQQAKEQAEIAIQKQREEFK